MVSLAETLGSLGKSLDLYINKRELSPFRCQLQKNLIMLLKTLLQIRDGFIFGQSLISYICDQINCHEIFSLFMNLNQGFHTLIILCIFLI